LYRTAKWVKINRLSSDFKKVKEIGHVICDLSNVDVIKSGILPVQEKYNEWKGESQTKFSFWHNSFQFYNFICMHDKYSHGPSVTFKLWKKFDSLI
jgi:hypothetical protein